jgi:NAD(P)-dependent dehydrogenase (short-subunit alcohol dehydrogenase family)
MIFGKTIVVTGVASGIGKRTAELLNCMGAEVIANDGGLEASINGQVFGFNS